MNDLKFPEFDKPFPAPKPWSTDVYAKWVLEQLKMMRRDGRLAKSNPIPTGKRFTLFPKD
jgi:hypothetical protein